MTWIELLNGLGIFTVAAGILAWLLKKLFSQILSRDLEAFKSGLEKEATAYRIRYEKLHTERVIVIKEVYKRIVNAQESLRSLINPWQGAGEPSMEEKSRSALDANKELVSYYQENRIFLEEFLAKDIDALLSEFRNAWNKFQLSQMSREDGEHKEARDDWGEAWKQISEKVPEILRKLENSFRGILGIENT